MIIFKQRKTQSRTSINITHEYILVTDDKYSRPYSEWYKNFDFCFQSLEEELTQVEEFIVRSLTMSNAVIYIYIRIYI
jgi:hypothetical protein